MMNRQQLISLTFLFLGMLGILHAQHQLNMNQSQFNPEQQQVLHLVESMTSAFHEKDIHGVMSCYEANATVVFEPETPISDRSQLKERFLQSFQINPQFSYLGHEVFIAGDIATHIAPWTMTGTAPDHSEIKQSGLSIAILRKQEDGSWLMVMDNPHSNFLLQKNQN